MYQHIKDEIKYITRKYLDYDLSTLRTKLDQDFTDQKRIMSKRYVKVIFDVGANIGQTTLKYKKLYPSAHIYGFEPYLQTYTTYTRQFRGDIRVHPVNQAFSDSEGARKFFVNNNHYTNSLLPIDTNAQQTESMSAFKTVKEISVKNGTMDTFCREHNISHVDILKLDTQGGEMMVLKGATKMLTNKAIDLIYTEVEFVSLYQNQPLFEDIQKFLGTYGYTLYKTYNLSHDKDNIVISGDAIFINQDLSYGSQYMQDRFLDENVFHKMTGGVFLEMGADDGLTHSNTLFFERERNWTGIAVEPRLSAFEKLRVNRTCVCENVCISDSIGKKTFLEIEGNVGQLSGLLEKYDSKHLKRVQQETDSFKEIKVECITMENLLSRHGIRKIDYFSLDVEGGELEILKSIKFEKFTINCISVENNYKDPAIKRFLSTKGYRKCAEVGIDEIYVLRNTEYDTYHEPAGVCTRRVYQQSKRVIKNLIKHIIRYDK